MIKSFLAAARSHDITHSDGSADTCVDSVIITVAPTIVGKDGIDYASSLAAIEVRRASFSVVLLK